MQGYGSKGSGLGGHIYPGSGATCDTHHMQPEVKTEDPVLSNMAPSTPEASGHGMEEPEEAIPDDPEREFKTSEGSHPAPEGPRIINVGIPGPGELHHHIVPLGPL